MITAAGARSSWIDRAVPQAVGSPTAQGINAVAGIIGLIFVLNTNDFTAPASSVLAFAVTIQSVAAVVIAIACAVASTNGVIRAAGIVLAGALRGLLVSLILIDSAEGLSVGEGIAQVLGSIVFTSIWLLSVGQVVQGSDDYQATFALRFEQAVVAVSGNLANSENAITQGKLDHSGESLNINFDKELARNVKIVSGEIHAAALDRIRPTSHRSWDHSARRPPPFRLRVVVSRSFKVWQAPIPLPVISASFVTGFGATVSANFPVGILTGTVVAIVAAGLLIFRQWIQRQVNPHEIAAMLLLIAIAPVTFIVLALSEGAIGVPINTESLFGVSVASFTMCFIVIAHSGIVKHRAALITAMN